MNRWPVNGIPLRRMRRHVAFSISLCLVLVMAPVASAQGGVFVAVGTTKSAAALKCKTGEVKQAGKCVKAKAKAKAAKSAASKKAVTPSKAKQADASCAVKGNISQSTKEKIYHVLGCPNYGQTIIDAAAGERMFCSEAEAKAAGWRKAQNCK